MVYDFAIGACISMMVMLVHLFATILIYQFIHVVGEKINENKILFLVISLVVLNVVLFTCLSVSVSIWAITFYHLGFVDNFGDAFYTAMLNYTTLGYGDLNQVVQTRIFGPMAASSGIMMFGWAAALLVYVIQLHLPTIIKSKHTK